MVIFNRCPSPHINPHGSLHLTIATKSVLAKIISGLSDILSGRPSMICRTFWSLAGHFSKLMTSNSFLPCRTFSVYWTLPDKMSGNVGALCRTSAEVCRTCPACPAYFARTDKIVLSSFYNIYLKPQGPLLWVDSTFVIYNPVDRCQN